jgi:protein-L-isoaspartate(D-aspartate) O-methyltransferase
LFLDSWVINRTMMRRCPRVVALVAAFSLATLTACGEDPAPTPARATPASVDPSASASRPTPAPSPEDDRFAGERLELVEQSLSRAGIKDQRVLEAMKRVPRHRFVPEEQVERAYENRPLPIGFGQTISQPYVVALMTELLDIQQGEKVLEIGTGSGYQGAVLAEMTDEVSSIEIIPNLTRRARATFRDLGYGVDVRQGDGYFGWPEKGPFDGIIVTAAPDHMPQPLIQQLAEGGNMVIPVGPPGSYQTLWRLTKKNGEIVSENITGVVFVPLVRARD